MKTTYPNPGRARPGGAALLKGLVLLHLVFGIGAIQSLHAQTHALTSTWSMAPTVGTNTFMNTTNHLTRGMAYNPVTGHVLVASRTPTATQVNAIYILTGTNSITLGTLEYPALITGGTFPINMVGVTTDGVIYVCNLTTDAGTTAFKLYRWANETATPELVYSGDPSSGNTVGASPRRFGDSMAIRGTGVNTQILLGTHNQTVALLTTADGVNFTPQLITTDGDVSDTRWGLAWGEGDTFWAKQATKNLKRYALDISAGTAKVNLSVPIYTVPGGSSLTPGGPMDIDLENKLLAIIDTTNHKLLVYEIADPLNIVQTDLAQNMPGTNANGNFVGVVYLKKGLLFALETNNGIRAYTVRDGVVFAPQVVAQPVSTPSLWEGAGWVLTPSIYGTRPLTYQWQYGGVDLPGKTEQSLGIPQVTTATAGAYQLVARNSSGSVTSSVANVSAPVPGNASGRFTNLWSIVPYERPYLTTNHNEYGIAINPVNTNVLVLTRGMPTNMLVVLDHRTGAEKYYIDYGVLYPMTSGYNKVDVADDGTVYLCNLSTSTTSNPFRIDALMNDGPTPTGGEAGRELYKGDPGNGQTAVDVTWGLTMAVRGNWNNAQILLGSGHFNKSSKTVAILQADANGLFTSTAITIPDAPDKFARLGVDWGPGTNTFWAKSPGNLVLVEFDLAAGTGFVKKLYPMTGARSVPNSVTGIKYDPINKLLAGIQNGSPPSPVSIPIYSVSDVEAGPLWVDQELFASYYSEINFQGNVDFANGVLVAMGGNNGIKAVKMDPSYTTSLPVIVSHPAGGDWFQGTTPTLSVAGDSDLPLSYQWHYEGTPMNGATATSLTLTNIQLSQAGKYMVRVSNTSGSKDSAIATINVLPVKNTAQMTNIWSVLPKTRPYLNDNYFEYGMAFNPATSNLVVASYIPTNNAMIVAVLDGLTGADRHYLDTTAITNGGNRWINKVGIADDGVVYVANRTTTPTTVPFVVYRWANDRATNVATEAFKGDPFQTMYPNKNAGWTMDVRGAGVNTEILVSAYDTNVLSILKTTDGINFTRNELRVTNAPARFARLGVCFGSGNTIWAKAWSGDGGALRLIEYDLAKGGATILKTYTTAQVAAEMTTVAYNGTLKLLGGISRDVQKNMQVYGVADLEAGPVLVDQEVFPTYNASIEANGALDFGGNTYLFGLNENNGIMAMLVDANYVQPPTALIVSAKVTAGTVMITWPSALGTSYQVQRTGTIGGTWEDAGAPVTATGAQTSYSEPVTPGQRFFRVTFK